MWKRPRSEPTFSTEEWNHLVSMIMGIDWKLDKILDELEIDDGEEEDRS